MPEPTPEQLKTAIATVVERSAKDQSFREKALKEPVAALNEAGNLQLPAKYSNCFCREIRGNGHRASAVRI